MTGQEIYQQLCLPESIVPQVMCVFHDSPSAGHLGVSKPLEKVGRRGEWHAGECRKSHREVWSMC